MTVSPKCGMRLWSNKLMLLVPFFAVTKGNCHDDIA